MQKSSGHIGFFVRTDGTKCELYEEKNGDVYTAPLSNVIDVETGNRIGRYECGKNMKSYIVGILLTEPMHNNSGNVTVQDGVTL